MGSLQYEPEGRGKDTVQGILNVSKISSAHGRGGRRDAAEKNPKVMMEGSMGLEDGRKWSGAVHSRVRVQASTLGSWAP